MRQGNTWTMVVVASAALVVTVAGAMAQSGGDGVVAIYEVAEGPPEAGSSGARQVGMMQTDGGATAVICSGGQCTAGPCNGCHTAGTTTNTSPARYSAASATRHFSTYFPKSAVRVAANARVAFGTRTVTSQDGRLVIRDRNGASRLRMPTGAQLIRTSKLEPLIVYPGSAMPQVVR